MVIIVEVRLAQLPMVTLPLLCSFLTKSVFLLHYLEIACVRKFASFVDRAFRQGV